MARNYIRDYLSDRDSSTQIDYTDIAKQYMERAPKRIESGFEEIAPKLAERGFEGRDIGGIYGKITEGVMGDVEERTAGLYESALGEWGATERTEKQTATQRAIAAGQRGSEAAQRALTEQTARRKQEWQSEEYQKQRELERWKVKKQQEHARKGFMASLVGIAGSMILGGPLKALGGQIAKGVGSLFGGGGGGQNLGWQNMISYDRPKYGPRQGSFSYGDYQNKMSLYNRSDPFK